MDRKTVERIARAIYESIQNDKRPGCLGGFDAGTKVEIECSVNLNACARAAIKAHNAAIRKTHGCKNCKRLKHELDNVPETPEGELKPCPFCGGEARVAPLHKVICDDCESVAGEYYYAEHAIAAWNRRA